MRSASSPLSRIRSPRRYRKPRISMKRFSVGQKRRSTDDLFGTFFGEVSEVADDGHWTGCYHNPRSGKRARYLQWKCCCPPSLWRVAISGLAIEPPLTLKPALRIPHLSSFCKSSVWMAGSYPEPL